MKKNVFYVLTLCVASLIISTSVYGAPTTFETVQTIMQANCNASGCHGSGNAQIFDVDASPAALYAALVGVPAVNTAAAQKGNKIVDPGHPYNSFLLRKVGSNGFDPFIQIEATERSSHPTVGLQDYEIELIRQWIQAGAEETGTVVDYQLLKDYYTNGGIDFIPVPAAPPAGKGFQLRYGPVFLEPDGGQNDELEMMKREHLKNAETIKISRMNGYMSWESHHLLLFKSDENSSTREGTRKVPISATPFDGGSEMTGAWQNDGDFILPKGTAFFWKPNTVLDFDYHVKNYNASKILPADFYLNIYYNENPDDTIPMLAALENDIALGGGILMPYLPTGQSTREVDFIPNPNPDHTEDQYIWMLSSHTHKYGSDYDIFLRNSDGTKGEQIYEGFFDERYTFNQGFYDYQHPPIRYYEPLQKFNDHDGLIYRTSWNVTGAPVTFSLQTTGEMMLFTYLYTKQQPPAATTGITTAEQHQNSLSVYPNPIQSGTEIRYSVDKTTSVKIEVFDMLGKKLNTLVDETLAPGNYSNDFGASQIAKTSGVYLITLSVGDKKVATRKITML